jgi:hypothetical protein
MDTVSKEVCEYLLPFNFIKLKSKVFYDLGNTLESTLVSYNIILILSYVTLEQLKVTK